MSVEVAARYYTTSADYADTGLRNPYHPLNSRLKQINI